MEVDFLIPKIKHAIEEVVNVKTLGRTYKSYTKWDMAMENIWLLSKNNDYKFSDLKSYRKNIKWTPPSSGCLKMNFDGACRGNSGESGYGEIIHDESNDLVGAKYGPMDVSTNKIVEVSALKVGLEWCVENRIHKVMIKGGFLHSYFRIMVHHFELSCTCRDETLAEKCDRLFDIDVEGQVVIVAIVEDTLSEERH
ncbi:hypothetical protein SUGI_1151850 [Cryptomeria japonica]|nr:hypothetical protein SUGI_1151850 [Cryptomeria japonica]